MTVNAYGPATHPIVNPAIVPERRALFTLRWYWPRIRAALITIILLLALIPVHGLLPAMLVALAYAGYAGLWLYLDGRQWSWQGRSGMHVVRTGGALVAVAIFVFTSKTEAGLLWVLFLIPVLTVGVDVERLPAFTIIAAAAGLAFLSPGARPVTANGLGSVADCVTKPFLILLVGITNYLLSRSLAYLQRLNERLAHSLPGIAAPTTFEAIARQAVQATATLFAERDGNVVANLLVVETGRLRMAASSSPAGQQLAAAGFGFAEELGITGWVARNRRHCFIQDVEKDPERRFLPHDAFPGTQSEMAVPIMDADAVIAVLDVESTHRNAFTSDDLHALEVIAAVVARAQSHAQMLQAQRDLAELSSSLARRVITVRDLGPTLREVGAVAMQVLGADIIGCYFKDPKTGEIKGPYTVGRLLKPDMLPDPRLMGEDTPVYRLVREGQIRWFADAQNTPELIRRDTWQAQAHQPAFVIREQVRCAAAVPLLLGAESIGLMFINYREPQTFTRDLRARIEAFAPLAALAIQSGLRDEAAAALRRERLARDLHDSILHYLMGTEQALDRLARSEPRSLDWKEALVAARSFMYSANRLVRDLMAGRETCQLQSLFDELIKHAWRIETTYNLEFTRDVEPLLHHADRTIVLDTGSHILFAVQEALGNAVKHANARRLRLQMSVLDSALEISVEDDGQGFDPATTRKGAGLANMRWRIADYLGGDLQVDSWPGQGTRVAMRIPLPPLAQPEGEC